ncbi:MAG: PilW family protein [Methylococcaceae bacterium]|nr:PilW family protein [Methylococcaceae bacterium]
MKNNSFSPVQQEGMTLVEVMIAMTIGLFLIAGVIQMFVSTKLSYSVQNAVTRISENSRFSLEFLAGNMRLAGYRMLPWQDSVSDVFSETTALFPNSGQYISGTEGGLAQADQINIRFQGSVTSAGSADGRILDCEGASVGNTLVELSFSLSGTNLICTINGASPVEVILADNVTNMQLLYGFDSDANGSVNQYVNASSVTDWTKVLSIKLGLVLSSEDALSKNTFSFPNLTDDPMNTVFDNNADGEPDLFKSTASSNFNSKTAADKRIYKVYTTTITLRNVVL